MIYQWGPSYSVIDTKAVSAQVVGERLEQIRASSQDGITPQQVLDDARPADSPLHNLFEWRNGRAAEQWRIYQARHVVNALRIRVPDDSDELPRTLMANISVVDQGERVYHSAFAVAADETLRDWALNNALNYLDGFRERYHHIQELQPVMAAIQAVLAKQQKPEPPRRRNRRRQPATK